MLYREIRRKWVFVWMLGVPWTLLRAHRRYRTGSAGQERLPRLPAPQPAQACQGSALLGTTTPESLRWFTPQTRRVTPHEGFGESSDNLPCPGEHWTVTRRKPGRAQQSPCAAPVKSVPYESPGNTARVFPLPARERGRYLHRVARSLSKGERKPKPTGISALLCIC